MSGVSAHGPNDFAPSVLICSPSGVDAMIRPVASATMLKANVEPPVDVQVSPSSVLTKTSVESVGSPYTVPSGAVARTWKSFFPVNATGVQLRAESVLRIMPKCGLPSSGGGLAGVSRGEQGVVEDSESHGVEAGTVHSGTEFTVVGNGIDAVVCTDQKPGPRRVGHDIMYVFDRGRGVVVTGGGRFSSASGEEDERG